MRTGDGLPAMTLCNGRALPVVTVLLRAIVACGVVLALVRLWLGITSLHGGLAFWAMPILLSGFGFVVARWWAFLLPPVLAIALPWYELHTGYLAFRSAEDSPGWTLLVMLSSLLCVALGVALSHGLSAAVRPLFPRSALYRDGIALALCLFCVLSAVMPPLARGHGPPRSASHRAARTSPTGRARCPARPGYRRPLCRLWHALQRGAEQCRPRRLSGCGQR